MSDTRKTGRPYIWVTWITKLLAGEEKCWLRAWVRVMLDYAKLPEDAEREANLERWTKTHDGMVNAYIADMRANPDVEHVGVEDDNAFKVEGKTAVLAGKPDVIVRRKSMPKLRIVVDAKSGKKRKSDIVQVLIYLWSLPKTLYRGQDVQLAGALMYQEPEHQTVTWDDRYAARIVQGVQLVTSDTPPAATPSKFDCGRCNYAGCPSRYKGAAVGQTELF